MADPQAPEQPVGVHGDTDSTIGEDFPESTASLTSSILDYQYENGRRYHQYRYRDGSYHFPNDAHESERLDLQYHLMLITLDGELGLAPPNKKGSKVERVLDAGTGTGIWCMDFADEHPEAHVIGVDLSPIQPGFVPPNVEFQVDDLEAEWTWSKPFDYIHSSFMNSSIQKWPEYLEKCLKGLAPGGYLELKEFHVTVCSDGTMSADSPLKKSMECLVEAAAKMDHTFADLKSLKGMMETAGFVDVQEKHFIWPSNTWPADKKNKELGMWNGENMLTGIDGFMMAPLTRGLGLDPKTVQALCAGAKKELRNTAIHSYTPVAIVWGRRPEA